MWIPSLVCFPLFSACLAALGDMEVPVLIELDFVVRHEKWLPAVLTGVFLPDVVRKRSGLTKR